jgi:nucleotide-binding universal stress UspA family protein
MGQVALMPTACCCHDEAMATESRSRDRIVAGVDGSEASRHAVLWAAQEARLRRCQLLIAHVAPSGGHVDGLPDPNQRAREMLEANAWAASRREPGVLVATLLVQGSVSDRLVELSRSAVLVALGVDAAVRQPAHGVLGPVEDRVIAQALCPVVTVNGTVPQTDRLRSTVIVGWVDNQTARRALSQAAAEARDRGGSLTVVSADPENDRTASRAAETREDASLSAALAALTADYPNLPIDVVYDRAEPGEALLSHAAGADLLVIGCHHSGDPFSIRIGPVASQAIRGASCPVMLVGRLADSTRHG